MAYGSTPIIELPEGLEEALPDMISKAMAHAEEAFAKVQEEMTEFYKGELPGITQEELDDGRSDIVSRDVHDAYMATAPDLLRIFTGPEHLVEFRPAGPTTNWWRRRPPTPSGTSWRTRTTTSCWSRAPSRTA